MRCRSIICFVILAVAGCIAPPPSTTMDGADAILVPRMAAQPSLDERMGEGEWADAHEIAGRFDIQDGSPAAGYYNFRLRTGATDGGLHLAIQFPNFTRNPWDSDRATYSDCVIFFFTDDSDEIRRPSYSIGSCTGAAGYTMTNPGNWNGAEWVIDSEPESGTFNEGKPSSGTWSRGNVLNGTMFMELYTARFPKETERNGLDLQPGSAFRMSLLFMRVGGNEPGAASKDARGHFSGPHDVFPGSGYSPNGHYDAKDWIRLKMPPSPPNDAV